MWFKKQHTQFRRRSVARHTTLWKDSYGDRFPEFLSIGDLQQDLLDDVGVQFPHPHPLLVETGHHSPSGHVNAGISPCITPDQQIWVAHRGRRLLGIEGMYLQGIWLPDYVVDQYGSDSTIIKSLAGNAFHSICAQSAAIVIFVLLGKLHLEKMCSGSPCADHSRRRTKRCRVGSLSASRP